MRVNDGRPHRVSFRRNKGEATLKVDGQEVTGSHRSSYLAAAGDIYLGMFYYPNHVRYTNEVHYRADNCLHCEKILNWLCLYRRSQDSVLYILC